MAVLLLVAGCSSLNPFSKEDKGQKKQIGEVGFVTGFLGGAVSDDPQATLVGRDILSAGGSAGDAAAAMYFTLAVTKPTQAGLAGGGVCLMRNAATKKVETLAFPARMPVGPDGRPKGAVPIPGNPRGFAVVHARLGHLAWAQVIQPAETLARFGSLVSRAFAADLRANASRLAQVPAAAGLFRKQGTPDLAKEGDRIDRLGIAGVLGRLRARGVGDFYQGQFARDFIEDANKVGGALTIEDMRAYLPEEREALSVDYLERTEFLFPSPPGPGGMLAADLGAVLGNAGFVSEDARKAPAHLLAEASGAAALRRGQWLNADGTVTATPPGLDDKTLDKLVDALKTDRHQPPAAGAQPLALRDGRSAAGLVAVDKFGSAVACTVTMNGDFGSGRVASSLGLLLAAPVGQGGLAPLTATPVLLASKVGATRKDKEKLFFAATATGGPGTPAALVNLALRVTGRGDSLERVMSASRLYSPGVPDVVIAEPGLSDEDKKELTDRGHEIRMAPSRVRLNVIYCETGVPADNQVCAAQADPRGFGLGAVGDR